LREVVGVVAAAAIAPVRTPAMLRDNIQLIEAIADALRHRPVAHILNIGSDAVFADSPAPLTESSCRSPGSLHGIMHLTRELMLAEAAGNTPFATLRPTLIYGAADPHNGYGPNRFRRLAAEGRPIVLFGNGEERRDHVWVEDVAELATRLLLRRSRGSLNAATGDVISFREIAEICAALHQGRTRIESTPRQGPMPHNGYRPFDPSATRRAFPDFVYTTARNGLANVHAATSRAA
jgi:nucleoside-diphosphate-sugar epimerase